jgi:alpha-galactosidase
MKLQHRSLVMWMLLASARASAATGDPVHYDPDTHVFTLTSAQVTYAFGVNERGELQSLYWGGRRDPG